jgi:hypothetical protein
MLFALYIKVNFVFIKLYRPKTISGHKNMQKRLNPYIRGSPRRSRHGKMKLYG